MAGLLLGIGLRHSATGWLKSVFERLNSIKISPLGEVHYFDKKFLGDKYKFLDDHFKTILVDTAKTLENCDISENLRTIEYIQALSERLLMGTNSRAYVDHMEKRCLTRHRFVAEVSPSYLELPAEAIGEMRRLFNPVKAVAVICDPISLLERRISLERLSSEANEQVSIGNVSFVEKNYIEILKECLFHRHLQTYEDSLGAKNCLWVSEQDVFEGVGLERIAQFTNSTLSGADTVETKVDLPTPHLTIHMREKYSDVFSGTFKFMAERDIPLSSADQSLVRRSNLE